MSTTRRMTVAFSQETQSLMTRLVPEGRRSAFVERAVREALEQAEREALRSEMAECAAYMYDEISALQNDFTPLEEELHRQV